MARNEWLVLAAVMVTLLSSYKGCEAISLDEDLEKPVVVVENSTVDEIILDCPYILTENDTDGLVIKWFYDRNVIQLFQWIPEGEVNVPQLSAMDDVIDLSYKHSDDPFTKYRALRLVNYDTSVSGHYQCIVFNHLEELSIEMDLVIYVLPKSLSLSVEEINPGNLSVVCSADQSFPEPHISLSMDVNGKNHDLEDVDYSNWMEGDLYNSSAEALVDTTDMSFKGAIDFHCTFTVPRTSISIDETLSFGDVMVVKSVTVPDEEEEEDQITTTEVSEQSTSPDPDSENGAGLTVLANIVTPLSLLLATLAWTLCSSYTL